MKGLGVSPGIAIGRIYVDWKEQVEIEKDYVDDVENELERLNLALEAVADELTQIYGPYQSAGNGSDPAAHGIYQSHGAMLKDSEFIGQIKGEIITENVSAPWAVKTVADKFAQVFEGMDNDALKAKADDVKDIAARVCRLLLHVEGGAAPLHGSGAGVILVCRNLNTVDITLLQKERIIGIIAEEGTTNSHAIIMARNTNKPAVVGIQHVTDDVSHGDLAIVDGTAGEVILNPNEDDLQRFRTRQQDAKRFEETLRNFIGHPVRSADGKNFILQGNAASPNDVKSILDQDGRGIGLFRTEYLYMGRDRLPTEGEQYWDYKRTVIAMKGCPVVFRTLDIGGDKIPEYLNLPHNENPALGHRAIRYSLSRVDIFRVQLRALMRASAHGEVAIMLPLVSTVAELANARVVLDDVKADLRKEGVPYNPNVPIGVMVETPSAAIISDLLAQKADFMSIGSNDLIQYTMAVDRSDPSLAQLYSPFHPAVLRLIRLVIKNANAAHCPVSLCGEMAGDPLMIPVLVGLGLRTFSVNPSTLLRTHWIITSLNQSEMEQTVEQIMALSTVVDVADFCHERFDKFNRDA